MPKEPALYGPSPPSAEGLRCACASPCQHLPPQQLRADNSGAFLVVQWSRICLPVQGTRAPSLFGELRSHRKGKAAQLYLTLCNPMDGSPPGSSVCGILQTRMLEWRSRSLLQGIFRTLGMNPGFLHCRQILYQLSYQGSQIFHMVWPAAAAAAKPLQSCPTLCDPIDGSPPGSLGLSRQEPWSGVPLPSPEE